MYELNVFSGLGSFFHNRPFFVSETIKLPILDLRRSCEFRADILGIFLWTHSKSIDMHTSSEIIH